MLDVLILGLKASPVAWTYVLYGGLGYQNPGSGSEPLQDLDWYSDLSARSGSGICESGSETLQRRISRCMRNLRKISETEKEN